MFNKRGFTFIELIMVIAILGILAVVAIPKYQDLTSQAKQASMKGIIGSVRSALSIEYARSAVNGNAAFPALTGAIFADGNLPAEVVSNPNSNAVVTTNENPIATFTDAGGYVYNQTTGEVRFNVANYHTY